MSDCTHECSTCGESCGERKEANVFEKKPLRPGCRAVSYTHLRRLRIPQKPQFPEGLGDTGRRAGPAGPAVPSLSAFPPAFWAWGGRNEDVYKRQVLGSFRTRAVWVLAMQGGNFLITPLSLKSSNAPRVTPVSYTHLRLLRDNHNQDLAP